MFITPALARHKYGIDLELIREKGYRYSFLKQALIPIPPQHRTVYFASTVAWQDGETVSPKSLIIPTLEIPSRYPRSITFSTPRLLFLQFKDKNERPFAYMDIFGNIFFPPFHQAGFYVENFAQLFNAVVNLADQYVSAAALSAVDHLARFNPQKVQRIVVETTFDKAAFIEEAVARFLQETQAFKQFLESRHKAEVAVLKKQLEKLKQRVASDKRFFEGFKTAFQIASQLPSAPALEGDKLVFFVKVEARHIKSGNYIAPAPPGKFFVENIKVSLSPTLTRAVAERAYHPNADSRENALLCLGTLKGRPLVEALPQLLTLFEMVNLDSCFQGVVADEAKRIFREAKQAGRVRSLREVFGWQNI